MAGQQGPQHGVSWTFPVSKRAVLGFALGGLAALALCGTAEGVQRTIRGQAVDETTGIGVGGALIRIVPVGDARGASGMTFVSDSVGTFRVTVPWSGPYRFEVEHIAYHPFVSAPLDQNEVGSGAPIDLLLTPRPIELQGLLVETDRSGAIERGVRRATGLHPKSLRYAPMDREEILVLTNRGADVATALRWQPMPSIQVEERGIDDICVRYRNRHCLPVYLNGLRIDRGLLRDVPLEMVETIVVLTPTESVVYSSGAILLFTLGSMR